MYFYSTLTTSYLRASIIIYRRNGKRQRRSEIKVKYGLRIWKTSLGTRRRRIRRPESTSEQLRQWRWIISTRRWWIVSSTSIDRGQICRAANGGRGGYDEDSCSGERVTIKFRLFHHLLGQLTLVPKRFPQQCP